MPIVRALEPFAQVRASTQFFVYGALAGPTLTVTVEVPALAVEAGRWSDGAALDLIAEAADGRTVGITRGRLGANGRALFHSSALHLTERLTRTAADRLLYSVTIDDPRTWTRPWTMSFTLTRDESYGMFEYACHEGNYGLLNILSASRAGERP